MAPLIDDAIVACPMPRNDESMAVERSSGFGAADGHTQRLARAGSPPVAAGRRRGPSSGKLEFKRYGDGRQRMKVTCRKFDVPDGAAPELRCGDRVIAVLAAQSGRTKLDEERLASEEAPPLAAGEEVTLRHEGVALLSGRLYVD